MCQLFNREESKVSKENAELFLRAALNRYDLYKRLLADKVISRDPQILLLEVQVEALMAIAEVLMGEEKKEPEPERDEMITVYKDPLFTTVVVKDNEDDSQKTNDKPE